MRQNRQSGAWLLALSLGIIVFSVSMSLWTMLEAFMESLQQCECLQHGQRAVRTFETNCANNSSFLSLVARVTG